MRMTTISRFAGVGAMVCLTSLVAADSTGSIDTLRLELDELRSRKDALSARIDAQDSTWLNEERAGEVRGLVQDVLADSQSRTNLQDSGMTAGYKAGSGFYLSSQDGSFSLMLSGELQARWVMNRNPGRPVDPVTGSSAEETQYGFQVRRATLRFMGSVVDPSWTYNITGSFEGPEVVVNAGGPVTTGVQSNGGAFEFQEAYIAKQLENGLQLTFGQFKTPWMREELVESSQQLAVERSVINEFYNQGRAVGIMASYLTDNWNLAASYNNGQQTALSEGTRYTNFTDNPADWSFSGRFEYKFLGDWSDFDSFTSSPGDESAIMVGVAGMGQKYGDKSIWDSVSVWGVTADISMKFARWSLFGSYVWQSYDNDGVQFDSWNPWGAVVQAGYSLTSEWELFLRYEDGNASGGIGNAFNIGAEDGNPSIVTLGANYFINDNVKFTLDWGINFADNMSLFAGNGSDTGWTSSDESDQWVLRAQLQLLF